MPLSPPPERISCRALDLRAAHADVMVARRVDGWWNLRSRRRRLTPRVDIDPRFHARSERRFDAHISWDLVCVGMGKLGVGDLEQRARHAIFAVPRESDNRMMSLAARAHDLGIL